MGQFIRTVTGILLAAALLLVVPLVTGHIPLDVGLWLLGLLSSTIGAIHVGFRIRNRRATLTAALLTVFFGLGLLQSIFGLDLLSLSFDGIPGLPAVPFPVIVSPAFLPDWWIAAIFIPAAAIVLLDLGGLFGRRTNVASSQGDNRRYTPLRVGTALTVLGFWGVLLATGITFLQKALVFAPIFEEMLKFGVALLFGLLADIHGRPAFLAIAVAAGSAFGVIEHFYTYPSEGDLQYLVRVVFHGTTCAASMLIALRLATMSTTSSVTGMAPLGSVVAHGANNTLMIPVTLIKATYGLSLGPTVSILLLVPLLIVALFVPKPHLVAVHRTAAGFLGLPTSDTSRPYPD